MIIGGIKSIGRAAEKLSPLKVGLYLVGGLVVILVNAARIPAVFSLVVREALTTRSALGLRHVRGDALRHRARHLRQRSRLWHRRRRLRHGAEQQPAQQGLNAVMELFIVSFVTSTISAR